MTDDDTARLRALAEDAKAAREWLDSADVKRSHKRAVADAVGKLGMFKYEATPAAILLLLDALDAARRERDEAKRDARELRFLWEQRGERANKAEDERDAAVALLREARYWSPSVFSPALRARIDAMLGGEGV